MNSSTATVALYTSGNGCKGIKTSGDLTLTAGKLTILTGGASYYNTTDKATVSSSGISCGGNLAIQDGTISISNTGVGGKGIIVDGCRQLLVEQLLLQRLGLHIPIARLKLRMLKHLLERVLSPSTEAI
jgi:hypothetical protein